MCCLLKAKLYHVPSLRPEGEWRVHSVFSRVVNIARIDIENPPRFVSLVLPSVGPGWDRIVVDTLRAGDFSAGEPVLFGGSSWSIGSIQVDFSSAIPWGPGAEVKITLNPERLELMGAEIPPLDPWFEPTSFGREIRARILTFLADPSPQTGRNILGLGPGLTPLGDDCLVGHFMALSLLEPEGKAPRVYEDLVRQAGSRTTAFSAFTLGQAYRGQFSRLVEEFFAEVSGTSQDFPFLQEILTQGSSSGPAIAWGFFQTLVTYKKD